MSPDRRGRPLHRRLFPAEIDPRFWILALFLPFLAFALFPDNREEHLRRWLASNRVLRPDQRADLERWLSNDLAILKLPEPIRVNPASLEGALPVVVLDGSIPGVVRDLRGNAAYDPKLDVIFVDRSLLLSSEGELRIDEDFLDFILLHEIGHRALRHQGFASFHERSGATGGGTSLSLSHLQETEADAYALDHLVEILRHGDADPSLAVSRLGDFVEETLLGPFLATRRLSVAAETATHPPLVGRISGLMAGLGRYDGLSARVKNEARIRLAFLRQAEAAIREGLWVEVGFPADLRCGAAAQTPFGAALLLSDGSLALVSASALGKPEDRRRRQTVLPVAARGHEIPNLFFPELNSGSAFWWKDGDLFLLRPYGRLFQANPAQGWQWRQAAEWKTLVGKAIDLAHDPAWTETPTVVATSVRSLHVYEVLSDPLRLRPVAELPWSPTPKDPGVETYEYVGASPEALFFLRTLGDGLEARAEGLYRLPLRTPTGLERIDTSSLEPFLGHASRETLQLSSLGDGMALVVYRPELHQLDVRISEAAFRGPWTSASLKLYDIEVPPQEIPLGFSAGLERVYSIDDSIVVIELDRIGVFAYETPRPSFRLVALTRSPFFSIPVGRLPVVLSAAPGGWRGLLWRILPTGGSDESDWLVRLRPSRVWDLVRAVPRTS